MNDQANYTTPPSPMTVRKLIEIITSNDRNIMDAVVVVQSSEPSIGPTSVVPITDAMLGFDWNEGKFILYPMVDIKRLTKVDKEILEREKKEAFRKSIKKDSLLEDILTAKKAVEKNMVRGGVTDIIRISSGESEEKKKCLIYSRRRTTKPPQISKCSTG